MTVITPADLRAVGYTVDDATTPGRWTVSGMGRTWVFPDTDAVTARQVYEVALTAGNIDLRTQAETALDTLTTALAGWDTLTDAQFKDAVKTCIEVVTHLTRLTIRHYTD
jgi:hypothetical protein